MAAENKIKKNSNRLEDLSPEELRKRIQEEKRNAKHSLRFAFTALIAIIAVCIAWFVNNTKVTSTVSSISASGSTFELASVGNNGVFDDIIPKNLKGENGTEWKFSENQTGTQTELNNTILWQLTDQSNIGNNSGESEASAGDGIRPGSQGQLEFYVIPKTKGELKLKFHLDIIPLKEDEDGNPVPYSENDENSVDLRKLNKLLKGHIMFFYSYGNEKNKEELISIETGEFVMQFNNNELAPIHVVLKWKWPYEWSDVKQITQITQSDNYTSLYKDYFFASADDSTNEDNYSNLYNAADMYIGQNAPWLMVQLSAQPGQ